MSEFIEITGGIPLRGKIRASGAKNAALPILISTLLTAEECVLTNVPNLTDTNLVLHLLEHFGGEVNFERDVFKVKTDNLVATEASYSLVKALRASFWVLAPLLARGRAARVALPGGDLIGARPVDIHLEGLAQMGAEVAIKHGVVYGTAVHGLRPATINFRFPSVGATHQLMMAAALTPGLTVLKNVAREPEVVALAQFLNGMGADIQGAGGEILEIRGRSELGGTTAACIGDRIEAGTYLLAAAITGGSVTVSGIEPLFFGSFLDMLREMGLTVTTVADSVTVATNGRMKAISAKTGPFPEFATDLQAPLMAALTLAEGVSTIEETVYEGRFGHASELCRMGAKIKISDRIVTIEGTDKLTGAPVDGLDIRAAASLVIAALAAEGTSQVHEPHHLRRGYELIEKKMGALGARMWSRISDPDDFIFAGC
jgi:UDP-N-acetylglucosamine 1-carboxyvinyltransferase